jgi:hypothetical protein
MATYKSIKYDFSGENLTSLSAANLTGTIADARISASAVAQHVTGETKPTISSISPSTITNAQTAVTITGTNFVSIPTVNAISTAGAIYTPDIVAYTSATTIVATFTLATDTTYFLRVENSDGNAVRSGTAILLVSDDPIWVTDAGSIGETGDRAAGSAISDTVSATGDGVEYTIASGSLPSGITLNSSTGVLSGTENSGTSSNVTYNFTIRATDDQAQYVDRAFLYNIKVDYNIEFLIVAGGGGGASSNSGGGAGGGAGGYRTSTQTVEDTDGTITIVVGTGGAASAQGQGQTQASDGTNSSIAGSFITNFTSTGGGGGGSGGGSVNGRPGRAGGSGGGGGYSVQDGGAGNAGSYSPVEGYAGGDQLGHAGGQNGGGGGGGASEVGSNAIYGSTGAPGGDGLQNDILVTGTNVYYAGGGAGASNSAGAAGGQGGGGASAPGGGTQGTDGLGGGGGACYDPNTAGDGGNGVVILRMPTADYNTGTTTGSPTVTTDGINTILKYLANGTYVA